MPDISMCQNKECQNNTRCYRFTATPNDFRQSWGDFKPDNNGNCDYFWEIKE
jgi:hypothetical protein